MRPELLLTDIIRLAHFSIVMYWDIELQTVAIPVSVKLSNHEGGCMPLFGYQTKPHSPHFEQD